MELPPPPNPQEQQEDIQPPPGPAWDPPLTADKAIFNGFMRLNHLPTQGVLAACQAGGINPPPGNANIAGMRQHVLEYIRDNLEPFPMDVELDGYCFLLADGRLKQAIRPPADPDEEDEDNEELQPQLLRQEVSDHSDGTTAGDHETKRKKRVSKKKRPSRKSKRYHSSSESYDSEVSSTSSDEDSHPKKKKKSLQLDILQSEFNRQPDDEQVQWNGGGTGSGRAFNAVDAAGIKWVARWSRQVANDCSPYTVDSFTESFNQIIQFTQNGRRAGLAPVAAGFCAKFVEEEQKSAPIVEVEQDAAPINIKRKQQAVTTALNYLAIGRGILNHARDAVRDPKSQKRDFTNVFLDDNLGRVKETFRNANMAINSMSSKSAKSIMNGRDERKVSSKRLETAKRNLDTIQKAFAAPQLQSWTGLDAASWFLENILLASNHSTNDKRTSDRERVKTKNLSWKVNNAESDVTTATNKCRNKYRSQRDYSKKDEYKRDDYKRDDRDRERDFARRDNTRFNPRVRIRSPPLERNTNDK
ncbi:hypothetical protein BDR26DRAFT_1008726 [Obelidium mucronatum]|nr:hypothetical protein BDR26DRAFT_1008726 [Obelidium mucronatum]